LNEVEKKYLSQDQREWWSYCHGDDHPPKGGPPIGSPLKRRYAIATTKMQAASVALLTTKPTRVAGIVAVLEYAMEREFPNEYADPEFGPDWDETVLGGALETIAWHNSPVSSELYNDHVFRYRDLNES
jgi:hypothetical protein